MRFAIEFSADAERDFDLVFDHLLESYIDLGEGAEEALDHAAGRVMEILRAADRLTSFSATGHGTRRHSARDSPSRHFPGDLLVRRRSGSAQSPCSCRILRRPGSRQADARAPPRRKRDALILDFWSDLAAKEIVKEFFLPAETETQKER